MIVKILSPWTYEGKDHPAGEVIDLPKDIAEHLLEGKIVEKVKNQKKGEVK